MVTAEIPAALKESGLPVASVQIYEVKNIWAVGGNWLVRMKSVHDLEPSPAVMAPNKSDYVLTHKEFALCGLMAKTVRSMVLVVQRRSGLHR